MVFCGIDGLMHFLQVPEAVYPQMREYLRIIFAGIAAAFFYNFFASLLRAVGNSIIPLIFLGVSAVLNIILDLVFILVFQWGIQGAAGATVLSQYLAGFGILLYTFFKFPEFRIPKEQRRWNSSAAKEIFALSSLTCLQQSVMNFGILLVQGRVNSFGPAVMAAFAAAVKIDSFAYMPAQDFGNAFSTFIAQNYGAGKKTRIKEGIRSAVQTVFLFCLTISFLVFVFAKPLMLIFVRPQDVEILAVGIQYLRVEGAFYCGIGFLFLFYGFFRAVQKPGISVILTVISLGIRVLLAYVLSAVPCIGAAGIWASIPIGWALADAAGILWYLRIQNKSE